MMQAGREDWRKSGSEEVRKDERATEQWRQRGNRMPIALRTPERPSATHKATGTATGTGTGTSVHSPTADAQGSSASGATRDDPPHGGRPRLQRKRGGGHNT